MTDYYRTLQVSREADAEVIERAYKALARKYHPDHHDVDDRTRANSRMRQLNEAYAVLRDPVARRRYDAGLPPEGAVAWDVFWDRGLVGMFVEKFGRRAL